MSFQLQPQKVVITDGAGFIGSRITDECVKRGWKAIILDNLSTGRIENIEQSLKSPSARFIGFTPGYTLASGLVR